MSVYRDKKKKIKSVFHLAEERWHRKCKVDECSCGNQWKRMDGRMSALADALHVPGGVGDIMSEG